MKQIIIFASGSGTNAENLINYFNGHPRYHVAAVLCNRPDAYVINRANRLHVPCHVFNKSQLNDGTVDTLLKDYDAYAIILAGFLMMVPKGMVNSYPGRIINIHPALLPKYGGKGMHGHHVHEAVVAAGEKESGITIHVVDEQYDHGTTIFQATCPVIETDTPDDVAAKIHELEQAHFPKVVEQYLDGINKIND